MVDSQKPILQYTKQMNPWAELRNPGLLHDFPSKICLNHPSSPPTQKTTLPPFQPNRGTA